VLAEMVTSAANLTFSITNLPKTVTNVNIGDRIGHHKAMRAKNGHRTLDTKHLTVLMPDRFNFAAGAAAQTACGMRCSVPKSEMLLFRLFPAISPRI
jgi:hypothetical protein